MVFVCSQDIALVISSSPPDVDEDCVNVRSLHGEISEEEDSDSSNLRINLIQAHEDGGTLARILKSELQS